MLRVDTVRWLHVGRVVAHLRHHVLVAHLTGRRMLRITRLRLCLHDGTGVVLSGAGMMGIGGWLMLELRIRVHDGRGRMDGVGAKARSRFGRPRARVVKAMARAPYTHTR